MNVIAMRWNQLKRWLVIALVMVWVMLVFSSKAIALPLPVQPLFASQPAQPQQTASVTLVNRFEVASDSVTDFLDRWQAIGRYMKQQPGFITAQLQKDVTGSSEWIMSEQWNSIADYRHAVSTSEFKTLIENFPAKATWFAQNLVAVR
jgi:quinol monooxygenase YgiN